MTHEERARKFIDALKWAENTQDLKSTLAAIFREVEDGAQTKDYDGMREFQAKFIKADRELIALRDELQRRNTELVEENRVLREYLLKAQDAAMNAFQHASAAFDRADRYATELRELQSTRTQNTGG